jgi:hypothetical protein
METKMRKLILASLVSLSSFAVLDFGARLLAWTIGTFF